MRIIIAILMMLMSCPVYGEIAAKTYSVKAYDEISDDTKELVWYSATEPLNSLVELTNPENGKKIVARVIRVIEPYYWNGTRMIGYVPRKERALLGQPDPIPVYVNMRTIKRGR